MRLLIDLYAMVFAFYRVRSPGTERVTAEGLCALTLMAGVLNLVTVIEIYRDEELQLMPDSRIGIICSSIALFLFLLGVVKLVARSRPELRQADVVCAHQANLPVARKFGVWFLTILNVVILIVLAEVKVR